ncbi:MAG TPA: sodium/solute symporter [Acidobacteriaceae bacterium]
MPSPLAALAFAVSPTRLSTFDLALVAVYLVAITLFGLHFREKKGAGKADKSLKSYFLANNTIPWWAIALSIVSAETSTLTIVSIPGLAFASNFGFLQLVIGYMLGRIVAAVLFLPRYFAGEMLTAYQLIDRRFGPSLHKVTAGLFLLTRAAAEGVRVFAVSIVVGIAIGTGDVLSIGIISALTLLYTFEGGMTAVIWTDVVQMFLYIGGTFVALITLGSHVAGGWSTIHAVAGAAGKFHMLNFAFNLTDSYTFWAGILGGTFLTMASHGTDQLMVQRMLAARSLRESQLALLSSGVVIFVQFTLFLLIGAGLFVFYGQHPAVFASGDRIFPTFIVREMPVGIAGLLVAAILAAAMSNLSAALNSLSSTTVVDFYMRLRPHADGRERGIISKSSTVLWALVLFAIAVYSVQAGGKGHVVEIGLSIASVAYGCLLGVFLLGTLTRYATELGASIGMVCGFALNIWLWQGAFPVHIGPVLIPKIAYPWYTIIGALVTFAIGSLASLIFRKQSRRNAIAVAAVGLALFLPLRSVAQEPDVAPAPNFTPVSTLISDAIAAHKLPGATLVIGHSGHVVFHQAYGNRKLAGEPGLDGTPSPAERMTEDTIFDMASLTKDLATATAVMQLYEQGKFEFDDPVEKYLPDFNPTHDPQRAQVTLRMLLTHFSGEPPDLSLKDPWGLAAPDRAEGFRRALAAPLQSAPGTVFRYSDINFILLGMLVEHLSGEPEDMYVLDHIYKPLGMVHTRYLPFAQACGPRWVMGAAVHWAPPTRGVDKTVCPPATWSTSLIADIAPTAHDNEGTAETNPDFDQLLRGTVHDPTTRRMGGVAGHAGLFSTAHDVSLFAQALLDRLAGRPSDFPLKQSTLELMTTPEQPGHTTQELTEANAATRAAGTNPADPLLAAVYPAIKGHDLRGYGWDIDTAFSKPRGFIFPIGSFGHTGFTGTTLWMDPGSDTYIVLLANAIHPRGNPPISNLRGEVATATARALRLYGSTDRTPTLTSRPKRGAVERPAASNGNARPSSSKGELQDTGGWMGSVSQAEMETRSPSTQSQITATASTLTGLDVLEATHFAHLATLAKQHDNHLRIGLLTNQAGIDANRRRTVDIFAADLPKSVPNAKLTALFSPEHGISGRQDTNNISDETEPATGLHVFSLYGAKPEQRHPTHEQLANLDAVVIDLQDAGVHFWTYEAAMGYFLEASARERDEFHHRLDIVILDRPNLVGGVAVQGPVSDAGIENYTNYMQLPARHGMTYGELARYFNTYKLDTAGKPLDAPLMVIAMQHWKRDEYFEDTHLPWIDPSPNLRDPVAATLYPGIGMIEATNISVGRGTDSPFHIIGAGMPTKDAKTGEQKPAWFKGSDVAAALTARHIPGVTFAATTIPVVEDANKYPFHGQTIEAVRFTVTDRNALDTPELGIEILAVLHKLYPVDFRLTLRFMDNQATFDALKRGDAPRTIRASWQPALDAFNARRAKILLY